MSEVSWAGRSAGSRRALVFARLAWVLACAALVFAAAAAVVRSRAYGVDVTLSVNGSVEQVRTTRQDVGGLLADVGLALRPEDWVTPSYSSSLSSGVHVVVERARPAVIAADGETHEVFSHAGSVAALLSDAGVRVASKDEIWLEGRQVSSADALPPPAAGDPGAPPRFARPRAWTGAVQLPIRLSVRRAVPLVVEDGTAPYTLYTTAATVGEALLREQVTLYLGDRVTPGLGSAVHAGMRVIVQRSKPVLLTVDGRTIRTRTRGSTVGDALADLGIMVAGSDRVAPPMTVPLVENLSIRVTRVLETVRVERQAIPFESIIVGDDELEIDQQRLSQAGEEGEFRRRWQLVYEDGVEKQRTLLDAWVATEPITRVLSYGRKIVSRPLPGAEGLTYWRKIRMYATAYSKSTAGVSPSLPYFGITRMGLRMTRGIVAVDPTVIPLGTRLYVPNYGVGLAGDTGGAIRGKMIDMGYDDENLAENLHFWARWVDVYILDPPPARSTIRWVLPNWPQ